MNKKLGVIVPYRNREEHLQIFKREISRYLNLRKIPFELIIINQDNAKLFNRGMLLNIGFKYAEDLRCDYVAFHDVDLIPKIVDYSYPESPMHLASRIKNKKTKKDKETFIKYFGGVTIFPMDDFRKINGYSNKYWGWGFEDDDLFLRCVKSGIVFENYRIKNIKNKFTGLFFNGVNSYVEIKDSIDLSRNTTILISFRPEDLICRHDMENDDFTVFSIPGGYNTSISYNSFFRYNFCTFDHLKKPLYINSKIIDRYQTNICVTFNDDDKIIEVYQDGDLIGTTEKFDKLLNYSDRKNFYLGATDPKNSKNSGFFKGTIDSFIIFSDSLSKEEIKAVSFGDFSGVNDRIKIHFDANHIKNYRLIDISGSGIDGKIVNCSIKEMEIPDFEIIKIPIRCDCLFYELDHQENGFLNNKWKDQSTRWNQLRFLNEVSKNDDLLLNDGLSDLQFIEHGITKSDNITTVNVGI